MSTPTISVIIPCYNEAKTIRTIVDRVRAAPVADKEIIIVDDGSKDGTAQIVKDLAGKCPSLKLISYRPNRGKGGAVKAGMLAAAGRYVLFADADGAADSTDVDTANANAIVDCGPSNVRRFLDQVDIIIGNDEEVASLTSDQPSGWRVARPGCLRSA